jgi:hypothetical protein
VSEPIRKVLSDKVTLVYGFPDGHCDVEVKVSLLPMAVKLRLDEFEVPLALDALGRVFVWNEGRKKNA